MIEILNPSEIGNWNDLLPSVATPCSFFLCSEWARILQETYRYKPLYFTIRDENGIRALLPVMEVDSWLTGKRGVALPFSDISEPLAPDRTSFEDIYQHVLNYGRTHGWRYLELRGGEDFFGDCQEWEHYWGHTLDLSGGIDNATRRLRESTRRNISKAEKEGIVVRIIADTDAMQAFVHLNDITRRDHGLPPQPRAFFRNVQKYLLEKGRGFIAVASWRSRIVAANVYFLFGDQVLYKYGASDRRFQRLRANNAIMWHAIKWSCENGYNNLCLGRTEPQNLGLRQFKTGWGGQEKPIRYYRYDLSRDAFIKKTPGSGFSKRIFEHLPIPVLNAAGKILYRHMG